MITRSWLFVLIFLASFSLYAQGTLFDVLDPTKSNNSALLSKNGKPVEGSPNLFDDYRKAEIQGKAGSIVTGEVNFDLYNQKLLFKVENTEYTANLSNISKIKVQLAPDSVAEFKYVNSTILQVLYEDSTHAVFIRHSVRIAKGAPGNGYTEAKNDRFARDQDYQLTKPFTLSFTDSKDLVKKAGKAEGVKEKINAMGKLKGDDKNRIIQVVKIL